MDDYVKSSEQCVIDERLALLCAHRQLREDHLKHVLQYRIGNLWTFRDGHEIPSEQAAIEHEEQACISEEIIRELEAGMSGTNEPDT